MKTLLCLVVFCSFFLAIFASGVTDCLQTSTPVPAQYVTGQLTLNQNVFGTGLNQLWQPTDVIVSPMKKLFVVDFSNQRVLRYPSKALQGHNNVNAEVSFGVVGLTGCNSQNFARPLFIVIDANDSCWISDESHHRVLKFENCSTTAENAPMATVVLGQQNFNTCVSTLFASPTGLYIDMSNALWVADLNNNRILKFDDVVSLTTGAMPSMQLGTGNQGCGKDLYGPYGITSDNTNLYVVDASNNRVVIFQNYATKKNMSSFDVVLGQSSTKSCNAGCSQSSLSNPAEIEYSMALGLLFVSDAYNSRVLAWNTSSALKDGALPIFQIGQNNFTSCAYVSTASATTLDLPYGIFYDSIVSNTLLVSDYRNNRVLQYCKNKGDDDDFMMPIKIDVNFN